MRTLKHLFILPAIACSFFWGASISRGDIVTLDNGERREGIVTAAPAEPDFIMFQDSAGQVKIARGRVKAIEYESDDKDWIEIGDQYYLRKRYDLAQESYQKAESAAPGSKDAADRMEKTKAAISSTTSAARAEQLASIDSLLQDAEKAVTAGQFTNAENVLYKVIPDMTPSAKQEERQRELKIELQKSWGKERLDKLAREAAATHFEEVLKLDPADKDAFNALLTIWADMPDKSEQVIKAYEARLEADPEDKVTRKNLADKYFEKGDFAKAVDQYENLYKSGNFRDSQINTNMVSALEALYKEAEGRQDYDTAITYYKKLLGYSDKFDEARLRRMQFWRDWQKTRPTDVDARTSLTLWARSQGMDQLALERLNELKTQNPSNEAVLNALRLYAEESLAKAEASLQGGKYTDAFAQATLVSRDYAYFDDIKEQATRLVGLANQELLRSRRQGRETAMDYKRQGDMYMGMGEARLEALRNQEVNKSVRIVSDRDLATSNFRLAMQYYQQALRIWPEMDAPTKQDIQVNLQRANRYYGILTGGRSIPLPDTRKSLGQ